MKNKKAIQITSAIITCCIFCIIFSFSSQKAEQSEGISRKISGTIVEITTQIQGQNLSEMQMQGKITKVDRVVRKVAHFSLYTIVGIAVMSLLSTTDMKQRNKILITIVIGMTYAISDEIHQKFVAGRTPLVTDVIIDTSGVIFGICIVIAIISITKRINVEKKST